jgi:cell division protein FtsQ
MLKKILKTAKRVLLIAAFLLALGFVEQSKSELRFSGLEINIDKSGGNFFVDRREIEEAIYNMGELIDTMRIRDIDLIQIEKLISNNPSVSEANVYIGIDGVLHIDIAQREPILRIFTAHGNSFYLDETSAIMPLSSKYTARVPVASGNIELGWHYGKMLKNKGVEDDNVSEIYTEEQKKKDKLIKAEEKLLSDLYLMADFIRNDSLWKVQIAQIFVVSPTNFELIPKVGKHKIIFGDVNDMELKFEKLKVFYEKGLNKTGWNEYFEINLKYNNQIVCTKKQ